MTGRARDKYKVVSVSVLDKSALLYEKMMSMSSTQAIRDQRAQSAQDETTALQHYADTLRELHRITSSESLALGDKVTRLLQLGLDTFGLDVALVSHIEGQAYRVEYAQSRAAPIRVGSVFDLSGTYCAVVVASNAPHTFHLVAESELRLHPCYRAFGLEAYIGTPLFVDGERFGTLSFSSRHPSQPFSDNDVDLLVLMAQWLGYEMSRARHQQALAQAKERAEAESRAKSVFLATVSHEIRNPMNGLLGMAQLLLDENLQEEHRRGVQVMLSAGRALMTLLDDILDFSSMEAGALRLRSQPFAAADVVAACADSVAPLARAKGLSLAVDDSGLDGVAFTGDAGRLRQILINLASNAVKFTDQGEVRVRGWLSEDQVACFEVSDTGIGIAAEERERLFGRFERATRGEGALRPGTGLGLAICKELCTLMGGTIGVTSEPGHGSTFRVELPLPRAQLASAEPEGSSVGDIRPFEHSPHVLLADDNDINRRVIGRMLERLGCRITAVSDGAQVLSALADASQGSAPVDLLLLDVRMPVLDGFATTRRVRAMADANARLPILALTAGTADDDLADCVDAGMDRLLLKPLDIYALADALRLYLEREPSASRHD